ncbi:Hpt domain-containing protein [Christensenella intestinihominis]|uniref:Hpt domain-containing protein n=1 Tax=Christensenella intestinihominis TaxID=1851429 RepID=UPI0009F1C352|nr:Hpt domain-containing protein [Christensenella intestinihominis]
MTDTSLWDAVKAEEQQSQENQVTIEECYAGLGSSYEKVVARLGKRERVEKFLSRFPADESYPTLCGAIEEGRGEEAFRAAHSLKGICMNLGLETLYGAANALTEALRGRRVTGEAKMLFAQVRNEYDRTTSYIGKLAEP